MNAALVNILERFENNNCKNLTILNIGRRKSRFKGYKIAASNDIVNKICESYLKSAKNSLESLNIEEYDFEGNSNKSILELDERLVDVNNLEDVFAEQADLITVIDKDTAFDKFHYIAIRYRYINDEVNEVLTIFAKYRQPAKSFRKSFKVAFMNDEIKEVKSEILSFDGYAEVRQFNNKFYIVQETTMSSLFDYKEGIKKYIDDHVEEINEFSILLNLDRFISDCKEDGRYNGRLCKAIQTQ